VAARGVSLFELSCAWNVFGEERESLGVDWYRAIICAPYAGPIDTDVPGVQISFAQPLRALRRASTIIVPPMADKHPDILEALRQAHRRGARLASLCTGAFLLAQAGLLDGRTATTHWMRTERLAASHPSVRVDPKVLYIDGGDILTSAGTAAGLDLCLHIVQQDYGADVANQVARDLVVPPHRAGGQAQYVCQPMLDIPGADLFAETLEWALSNLDAPLGVASLARRAGMSSRTFARRFTDSVGVTPHQWVLRQRVQYAQRLLETSDLPIDQVANRSGLGSATNMRNQFRQLLGTSPASYRRTFFTESALGS
jgi:AraC family transcriptional regulator, transcriptional activator FtrA